MSTPKLVDLGIKRKEMYGPSEPEAMPSKKDGDNEMVHPSLHVDGPHAVMMGAEDLKKGDRVRQTVEWVVDEHTLRQENGKKPQYSMRLKLAKASDCEAMDGEDDKGDGIDDGDGADDSPAMAFITGRAKSD